MEPRREELKERIDAVQRQPRNQRRYGAALKREIVAYVQRERAAGRSLSAVAAELGLHKSMVRRWLHHVEWRTGRGLEPFTKARRTWSKRRVADHGEP